MSMFFLEKTIVFPGKGIGAYGDPVSEKTPDDLSGVFLIWL